MNRRWRNLTTRSRQRRFDPPFVGLAPAAPTTPVVFKSSRRRTSVVARRGEFFPLVSVQQLPPGRVEPTPKRIGKARRGSFFAIVPQALAAGPAPLVPIMAATRRPRPTMEPRRGAHFAAPLQGAVAGTAPLVPSLQRQTRRPGPRSRQLQRVSFPGRRVGRREHCGFGAASSYSSRRLRPLQPRQR